MSRFRFLTGSYTESDLFPGSRGEGVRVWELDSDSGSVSPVSTCDGISNPSWIAVHPSGNLVAVASEHIDGASEVCLLKLEPDGSMRLADSMSSGDATCHVAFSPDGNLLASASYVGGEVQLMLMEQERFNGKRSVFAYQGQGPNRGRQESPHAHQVIFSPDSRFLYVTDLGSDRIWCHQVENGSLSQPDSSVEISSGEGPRHMAVNWRRHEVYLLAELTGRVHRLLLNPETGGIACRDSVSSLPDYWCNGPSSAAVRMNPSKSHMYVSNRNGGLITGFKVGAEGGRLKCIGFFTTDDPSPRDFNISPDGRWLLVAGQETHLISVHPVEPDSGEIGPAIHSVDCGSPVCLEWITSANATID
jgi:6-phosphogluconolactonase